MFIRAWAPEDAGVRPKAPFGLIEISCRSDETGAQLKAECAAGGEAPMLSDQYFLNPGYLGRARACFALTPRPPSDAAVKAATEAWRKWLEAGAKVPSAQLFSALPDTGHAYLEIWNRRKQNVPVFGNSCGDSNAHRGPRDPICDPGMVPTGRTQLTETLHADVIPPREAKDVQLFPPVPLDVFWILIGTFTDHFVIDPSLVPSPTLGVTPPAQAIALLEPRRHEGPPERRAAILVDLAISAFELKDVGLGRRMTRELEDLIAQGALGPKALEGTLPTTLRSLKELAAGKWLLADPCDARPLRAP